MPGGLGPRFALEAGFLILLAAVAAYARLDAGEIILVMAAGWLVASIFEVLAARRERLYPGAVWERRVETKEAPSEPPDQPEAERRLSWFRRRPPDATAPLPDESADEPAAAEPAAEAPPTARTDDEATGEIELPKRSRWFRRGRPEPEVSHVEAAARPSARHVRLIRGSRSETADVDEGKDAEARP
jgi:hypothetical protein